MRQLTEINDPRLVKALAHPLRVQILRFLETREASPNEIANVVGVPVSNVSYHMHQLVGLELVEMTRAEKRRGVLEHYYRLSGRVQVTDAAWRQVPTSVKVRVTSNLLAEIGETAERAASVGGFDREDIVLIRRTFKVDDDGFKAIAKAAAAFLDQLQQIDAETTARLAQTAGEQPALIDATVVTMVFEGSPPSAITSASATSVSSTPDAA